MIRKYFYVRHILPEPFLDHRNGLADSQNNGHSWSLDVFLRRSAIHARLTRDKEIEIERTHIWLNGYGMSVVNMLEFRFSGLFTYTR